MSRPSGPKPGPEVWIGWINAVGGDRPMLGARKYDSLRREQKLVDAPWARTLMRWAGMPWSQMCAAAGKSGGDAGPPPWSDAAKVKALRAAAAAIGRAELLTLEVYMEWRAAQPDPGVYPSGAAFGAGEWLAWCERARVESSSPAFTCSSRPLITLLGPTAARVAADPANHARWPTRPRWTDALRPGNSSDFA